MTASVCKMPRLVLWASMVSAAAVLLGLWVGQAAGQMLSAQAAGEHFQSKIASLQPAPSTSGVSPAEQHRPEVANAPAPQTVAAQAVRQAQLVQRQPAVAYGAGVFLVAWSDGSRQADQPEADIYCARIDAATGKPLDPQGLCVCAAADLQQWPAVAFDGKSFLVVWQDFRSGKHYDVYAARVSPQGKVLDPDGFAVSAGPHNEARPAVAFAAGNYTVVWMDARQYPVYGIYCARVSPAGQALDPQAIALDVEDAAKIAKFRPPAARWLGEHDYWWDRLASRYLPAIAANGKHCLVAYTKEYPFASSGRPKPTALLFDPAAGTVLAGPVQLTGGAYSVLAVCQTPQGWAAALADHAEGWDLSARLAVIRVDRQLQTTDSFAKPHSKEKDNLPVEYLEKTLLPAGCRGLNPGKGALSFWRPAIAWTGDGLLVATDFGWQARNDPNAISYVIAANKAALVGGDFLWPRSAVLASTARADQAVANPSLAADPEGKALLVYERDEAIDRQLIEALLLPGPNR